MAALPPLAVSLIVTGALSAAQVGLAYLMREKGNQNPVDSGKMDDLRITGSEYGSIIPRVWGRARIGANIIWSSGIKHSVIAYPSAGGKGVPQAPATRTHVYETDFGVQICRGPLDGIDRIWADAEVIGELPDYIATFEAEDATKIALTGGNTNSALDYADGTASKGEAVTRMGKYAATQYGVLEFNTSTSPTAIQVDPTRDKTALTKVDIVYKCSGNKTMRVYIDTPSDAPDVDSDILFPDSGGKWTTYSFTVIDDPVGEINGEHVSLVRLGAITDTAAGPDIDRITVGKTWMPSNTTEQIPNPITGFVDPLIEYPDSLDPASFYNAVPVADATGRLSAQGLPFEKLELYLGTTNQVKDQRFIDYLDTRYGVGQGTNYAPAFRETAVAVFYTYNLRQGRIPNLTFEVYNAEANMSYVLEDLFLDCGLTASDYDLTGASSYTFVGVVDSSKQSRKAFIENLGRYFGFRLAEFGGKIRIVDNDTFTSVATISADLLRARPEGTEPKPYDAELLVSPVSELPQLVRFNVMNPDLEYHNETVQAFVSADVYSADTEDLNFPIVERPEPARKRAEYFLLKAYAESKAISFEAMPEMLRYSIGDVITVPINGTNLKVRIEKITAALPLGVVKVDGFILEEYEAGDIETVKFASDLPSFAAEQVPTMTFPRNSKAIPIMSLPIRQIERGRLGCYIAVTPTGFGESQNIALYNEQGADNYVLREIYDSPSTCGVTDGTLATHSDPSVEDSDYIDVFFYNNISLESVLLTDIQRFAELNLIRIGDEWIQFRTATKENLPVESQYRSKWRLQNLTRGRFNTSDKMSSHGASEDVTLFTNNLKWFDFRPEDVGESINIKTTSGGQAIEDVRTTTFTLNPVSLYSVTNDDTDREFDANSTTIHELANVVATVIDDLNL